MTISPPPIIQPLFDDPQNPVPTLPWVLFFGETFSGDAGNAWTPSFTNLTVVGAPTITGRYYKVTQSIAYFSVVITPSTNTSSTAGVTYINNLPFSVKTSGPCFAMSGNLGAGPGMVDNSSNNVYVPGWTAVTVPLTIVGVCEIR